MILILLFFLISNVLTSTIIIRIKYNNYEIQKKRNQLRSCMRCDELVLDQRCIILLLLLKKKMKKRNLVLMLLRCLLVFLTYTHTEGFFPLYIIYLHVAVCFFLSTTMMMIIVIKDFFGQQKFLFIFHKQKHSLLGEYLNINSYLQLKPN